MKSAANDDLATNTAANEMKFDTSTMNKTVDQVYLNRAFQRR